MTSQYVKWEIGKTVFAAVVLIIFVSVAFDHERRLDHIRDTRFTLQDGYELRAAIWDSVPPPEVRMALDSLREGLRELRRSADEQ